MTKLLTEEELRKRVIRLVAGRIPTKYQRENHEEYWNTIKGIEDLIQSQKQAQLESERTWYVVDKDTIDDGWTIILGPFTTSSDAAVAREYIERKDTRDRTYWLEQRERNK